MLECAFQLIAAISRISADPIALGMRVWRGGRAMLLHRRDRLSLESLDQEYLFDAVPFKSLLLAIDIDQNRLHRHGYDVTRDDRSIAELACVVA